MRDTKDKTLNTTKHRTEYAVTDKGYILTRHDSFESVFDNINSDLI